MSLFKNFGVVFLLISSLNSKGQSTNTGQKCTSEDDCCKKAALSTNDSVKPNSMNAIAKQKEISCRLTSPELQKRKESVLASLRKQLLDKQDLPDGYKYKFESSDSVIDELISFIKTERLCCDFFSFSILIPGDKGYAWMSITGPEGAKEFIKMEMDL